MQRPPETQSRGGRRARALSGLALTAALGLAAAPGAQDFDAWRDALAQEAIAQGISPGTVEAALANVELQDRVLALDRTQPGKGSKRGLSHFCGYLEKRLTETRIERGRRVLEEEAELLAELTASYGVPERYLVALWGLETNFGDYLGDFPVVDALVTLAHDPRRGKAFRRQVFAALRILDEGHRELDGFVGSWAGAMGQVQFMPTTFLGYAVDHDGDGRKDLWESLPDSLASAANYLRRSGWRAGETWGREVRLPEPLERDAAALSQRRKVSDWGALGVRRADGGALPQATLRGEIVQPLRGPGPSFLAYRNYRVFKSWNNSTFFAVSVGALADVLGDRAPLRSCSLPRMQASS